jgi:predicted nucleic acid-binding protein
VVIVDSSVWIDYLAGRSTPEAEWLDREATIRPLGITDLILCEVLQGIRDEREFNRTRDQLLKLHVFSTGGIDLAIAAAKQFRMLRARGRTVRKTIDCLIATYCLLHDHTLLHNDRDYDAYERELGLLVVHPDI